MHSILSFIPLLPRGLWAAAALMLFVGCSTPTTRISKNPELFASFPLSAQERIRAGEVDLGFTPEMVTMALGRPTRIYARTTRDGESDVWAYTAFREEYEQQLVEADFRYKDSNGIMRTGRDQVWASVKMRIEYDTVRVELKNNRVIAVEKVN